MFLIVGHNSHTDAQVLSRLCTRFCTLPVHLCTSPAWPSAWPSLPTWHLNTLMLLSLQVLKVDLLAFASYLCPCSADNFVAMFRYCRFKTLWQFYALNCLGGMVNKMNLWLDWFCLGNFSTGTVYQSWEAPELDIGTLIARFAASVQIHPKAGTKPGTHTASERK